MFKIFYRRLITPLLFSLITSVSWPTYAQADAPMVGEITRTNLQQNGSTKKWMSENYLNYSPDMDLVKQSQSFLSDVSITMFLGTWCHDSQREVPALLKILDTVAFKSENIRIIALSLDKDTPSKIEGLSNISRTPTFVFYRDGREIGRYVEQARHSLDQDILDIVSGVDYRHYYAD
tara:strand:- start:16 stop:546 length:531 start_codon:yes stop_codon:yes gene_type:complete